MIDLHVHTNYSVDSDVKMEDYCKKALEKGLQYVCFTDHVDFNRKDPGYGYYNSQAFFEKFYEIRERYGADLGILCGIEFSEPHIYKREFDELRKKPYDFILGSVHYWGKDMSCLSKSGNKPSLEILYEKYWEEVYKAVTYGGFDSLAHIDYPKRYLQESIWSADQMNDIFKNMLKNDIALEINTSSLRRGLTDTMPGRKLLSLYRKAGGLKITIGADTHKVEDLAADYGFAEKLADEFGLISIVFIKRLSSYPA